MSRMNVMLALCVHVHRIMVGRGVGGGEGVSTYRNHSRPTGYDSRFDFNHCQQELQRQQFVDRRSAL